MDAQQGFAAIGEPTRFRIVTLLADGPRTVGEVAAALGALQPQTTKHVQALESAGVLRVQRLGRRRLASLNRETLRELAGWLDALAVETEDDQALAAYVADVEDASAQAGADGTLTADIALERRIGASRNAVWQAWTDSGVAARWWAPRHFEVIRCAIDPEPGARVELVLREGDGSEYVSAGVVRNVEPGARLAFDLSPLDACGETLFLVEVEVRLEGDEETLVHLAIRASRADVETAPMLAGLKLGWSQQLDRLETLLTTA